MGAFESLFSPVAECYVHFVQGQPTKNYSGLRSGGGNNSGGSYGPPDGQFWALASLSLSDWGISGGGGRGRRSHTFTPS